MKKLLALLLILALLTPVFAACGGGEEATSTTENKPPYIPESTEGLKFELNEDEKSYTLVGIGACKEKDIVIGTYNGLPVTAIAKNAFATKNANYTLKSVVIHSGTESIGNSAFNNCVMLESIDLPDTLKYIGASAFKDCAKLSSVILPEGIERIQENTFDGCQNLEGIKFPKSLKEIGPYAFLNCVKLKYMTIPEGIEVIAQNAFQGCTTLDRTNSNPNNKDESDSDPQKPVGIWESVTAFDGKYKLGRFSTNNFYCIIRYLGDEKDIVIPKEYNGIEIRHIGIEAFQSVECDSITIPNTIVQIYDYAFSSDYGAPRESDGPTASKISFEEGSKLEFIGEYAFGNCNNVEKIEIPDSVTKIEESAFYGCDSLTEVVLPKNITELAKNIFSNCEKLEKIELSGNLKKIGSRAFYACSSLKEVKLPDGLVTVEKDAFHLCSSLESIYISKSVTEIDNSFGNSCTLKKITVDAKNTAFSSKGNCLVDLNRKALLIAGENAVIPDDGSVETIAAYSFGQREDLTEIHIPASVLSIESKAFELCKNLQTVTCASDSKWYHVNGNCLIATHAYELVLGTNNSIIPNDGSVTVIGKDAFNSRQLPGIIKVPEGIVEIQKNAFLNCHTLEQIDLPESLRTIGVSAFSNSGLKSITVPGNVKSVQHIFEGLAQLETVIFAEGVEELLKTFNECHSLKSVTLPSTLKRIGQSAFFGCTSLEYIRLPRSLEYIESNAFYKCPKLINVELESGIAPKTIPINAFGNCELQYHEYRNGYYLGNSEDPLIMLAKIKDTSIIHFEISEHTDIIGPKAFSDCKNLLSIVIPETVNIICNEAFGGCTSLSRVVLHNGITVIPNACFYECSSLTKIELPSNLVRIGYSAFYKTDLSSIEFPDTLERIEGRAFMDNKNITSLFLPDSITHLGEYAFENCRISNSTSYGNAAYYQSKYNPYFVLVCGGWNNVEEINVHPDTKVIASHIMRYTKVNTVNLPEGLEYICESAFYSTFLKKINIPSTLKRIEARAFYNVEALNEVTYNGTIDQWNNISIDMDGDWRGIGKATIHCIDGDIVKQMQ